MGHCDDHACQAYAALGSVPGLMVACFVTGASAVFLFVIGLG